MLEKRKKIKEKNQKKSQSFLLIQKHKQFLQNTEDTLDL